MVDRVFADLSRIPISWKITCNQLKTNLYCCLLNESLFFKNFNPKNIISEYLLSIQTIQWRAVLYKKLTSDVIYECSEHPELFK